MFSRKKAIVCNLQGLLSVSAIGIGSLTLLTTAVTAQTPAPQPAVQKVDKVEVTGSNIKRVDAESASPITVITSEDIRRSGATSVQELLNNLSMASGGALTDVSGGNGFAAGSATVALRGLGSAATLTLINGRRISPAKTNCRRRPAASSPTRIRRIHHERAVLRVNVRELGA